VEGTYRFFRQIFGRGHFAEVKVSLVPADQSSVVVAEDTFGWLTAMYPATDVSSSHDDLRGEAIDGVRYAVRDVGRSFAVIITKIVYTVADTGPGDMKFAAAHAVWQALGQPARRPPSIEESGVQFPD